MYSSKRKSRLNLAVGYGLIVFGAIGLMWVFGLF
jgi:hypothetical protein